MWGPLENSELIWPVLHINILIIKSNQIKYYLFTQKHF